MLTVPFCEVNQDLPASAERDETFALPATRIVSAAEKSLLAAALLFAPFGEAGESLPLRRPI
jgi:hypothetical protein